MWPSYPGRGSADDRHRLEHGRLSRAAAGAGAGASVRIKGLVLVAPAADMTQALMEPEIASNRRPRPPSRETGVWLRPSQYGEPYPITRKLIEDGRRHLLLAGMARSRLSGAHSARRSRSGRALAARAADIPCHPLGGCHSSLLIKGGDHRLSRDHGYSRDLCAAEDWPCGYYLQSSRRGQRCQSLSPSR